MVLGKSLAPENLLFLLLCQVNDLLSEFCGILSTFPLSVILTDHCNSGIVGRTLKKTQWKFLFFGNLGLIRKMLRRNSTGCDGHRRPGSSSLGR